MNVSLTRNFYLKGAVIIIVRIIVHRVYNLSNSHGKFAPGVIIHRWIHRSRVIRKCRCCPLYHRIGIGRGNVPGTIPDGGYFLIIDRDCKSRRGVIIAAIHGCVRYCRGSDRESRSRVVIGRQHHGWTGVIGGRGFGPRYDRCGWTRVCCGDQVFR